MEWAAEIADRIQAGEPVDLEELTRAHPERAALLRRLLPAIEMMAALGPTEPRTPAKDVAHGAIPRTVRRCSAISSSSASWAAAAWGSSTKPASSRSEVAVWP